MCTLWRLYEKNEAYQAVLHIDDLAPSDKMELGPVKNLFKVLSLLEKETEADCVVLHTFIKQMKSFHDLFELPQIAFADQIRMLAEVEEYFSSWSREPGWKESCITAELELQISTTLKSLQRIETSFGTTLSSISHLGTNVVENYFSIVWSKIRYPNFFEYAYTSVRAWIELTKAFATDLPYPMHYP